MLIKILKYTLLPLLLLSSCSTIKFIPEGQYLLDNVVLTTDSSLISKENLMEFVQQQPNSPKLGLLVYNLVDSDSVWWKKAVRKLGEPPIIFNQRLLNQSLVELSIEMKNRGFLNSSVSAKVDSAGRKAAVNYLIHEGTPYKIRNYKIDFPTEEMNNIALGLRTERQRNDTTSANPAPRQRNRTGGQAAFNRGTLLKEGTIFDMSLLEQEMTRISARLRNSGYYRITADNLHYLADTALSANQTDLTLHLNEGEGLTDVYRVGKVRVFSGMNPTEREQFRSRDSVEINGITAYYDQLNFLRPGVIADRVLIRPGRPYRQRSEETTLSLFRALNCVSRAEINWIEGAYEDSTLLDCDIYLSPADNHSLQTGLSGTNKAGDLGLALDLDYGNQNLFNGSELFNIRLKAAYEFVGSNDASNRNFYEFGLTPALTFSEIQLPFVSSWFKNRFTSETRYSLGFDIQKRPQYVRNFFNAKWQFQWTSRNNLLSQTFSLLDVNYASMPWMSDEFKRFLNTRVGTVTRYSYEDVFTVGSDYSLIYTNTNTGRPRQRLYTLRFGLESSGNALNRILSLFEKKTEDAKSRIYDVFGSPYAQYVKGDIDLSQTMPLSANSSLALHASAGIAFPYNNSQIMPFEKRYYAGGPNSVRGWHTRYLGPGTMTVEADDDMASHVGDISLNLNAEYRYKALSWLEPAFFVDCGNIWTIKNYIDQPGGAFRWNQFYRELAVGTGLGLRFDLSFLIIRFDIGTRVYDPSKEEGQRYVFLKNRFWSNSALYFAIGYPF
ncbi:MAG: BamA/TamA family outer membrane protein [Dysgonamonadaceae bacterium]|nr:BamA/TamA family outer membrane protein [Dysgonamonadaceae bacterium]